MKRSVTVELEGDVLSGTQLLALFRVGAVVRVSQIWPGMMADYELNVVARHNPDGPATATQLNQAGEKP